MEETTNFNTNSKPSSSFAKRIASAFRSVTKSKSLFSLFEKLSLFSHKIHSQTLAAMVRSRHPVEVHLLEHQNQKDEQLYLDYYGDSGAGEKGEENDHDDGRYPDLRHYLFEEEEEYEKEDDPKESVIDMVKNEKLAGEDFKLEDEIDHVADLFITKFHKQLRLQKLDSFKRYKDMLKRSV